jgi:hypothetical protein
MPRCTNGCTAWILSSNACAKWCTRGSNSCFVMSLIRDIACFENAASVRRSGFYDTSLCRQMKFNISEEHIARLQSASCRGLAFRTLGPWRWQLTRCDRQRYYLPKNRNLYNHCCRSSMLLFLTVLFKLMMQYDSNLTGNVSVFYKLMFPWQHSSIPLSLVICF